MTSNDALLIAAIAAWMEIDDDLETLAFILAMEDAEELEDDEGNEEDEDDADDERGESDESDEEPERPSKVRRKANTSSVHGSHNRPRTKVPQPRAGQEEAQRTREMITTSKR